VTRHGATGSGERRRRKLVDARIQGRLLGALLAVEVALVIAALWVLYLRVGAVIDQNLYRVHHAGLPSLGELLLPAVVAASIVLLALNCVVVLAIERQWAAQVRAIVARFGELARRTGELDFSPYDAAPDAHPAVREMQAWREALSARHGAVRVAAARLDPDVDARDAQAVARQRAALRAIREALDG